MHAAKTSGRKTMALMGRMAKCQKQLLETGMYNGIRDAGLREYRMAFELKIVKAILDFINDPGFEESIDDDGVAMFLMNVVYPRSGCGDLHDGLCGTMRKSYEVLAERRSNAAYIVTMFDHFYKSYNKQQNAGLSDKDRHELEDILVKLAADCRM